MGSIMTIPAYRAAVRSAEAVFAQVRFGTSERWLRITKAEALRLVEGVPCDTTPQEAEMYSGQFAELDGTALYIG